MATLFPDSFLPVPTERENLRTRLVRSFINGFRRVVLYMLPNLPEDLRWGSFVTHSFLPHGDKRNPTDVCGEVICYPVSRGFFLAWFLSFTKLLVSKSLTFMACLLPQEKLEGVNKPARRMRDANDSANGRFSQTRKNCYISYPTMFKKMSFLLYCFQLKLGFLARTIPIFASWLE